MRKPRILILLDRPELSGGVLNAARVGSLLEEEGYQVGICAEGGPPDWLRWRGAWHDHQGFRVHPPSADLFVCTYWTTVRWAAKLQLGPRVHFCQGYEGDLIHLADAHSKIEDLYRLPGPMWVVSPMLAHRLAPFRQDEPRLIPPVPAPGVKPLFRRAPRSVPRILVPGIFEAEVKNVPAALLAIQLLRKSGRHVELHRLSSWPCSREEQTLCPAEQYHHALPPRQVSGLLRKMDLLLFPSRRMEGFGLPVLEACQAGVPAVISDIPSVTPFVEAGLPSADPEDPQAFVGHALRLLSSPAEWRAARADALRAAQTFSKERTRDALRAALASLQLGSGTS